MGNNFKIHLTKDELWWILTNKCTHLIDLNFNRSVKAYK